MVRNSRRTYSTNSSVSRSVSRLVSKIARIPILLPVPQNIPSSMSSQLLLSIHPSTGTPASGSAGLSQPSAANHPFPRHSSSRQPLQQINLLLTVHLDWINLELGAITAIGSHWYSQDSVCYPLSMGTGLWIDYIRFFSLFFSAGLAEQKIRLINQVIIVLNWL